MINWILPHCSTRKQPCQILNNILKEYEPRVKSLCKGVTGSVLRGGQQTKWYIIILVQLYLRLVEVDGIGKVNDYSI